MTGTIKDSINGIKKLEQKMSAGKKDPELLKKLGIEFGKLKKSKEGPLAYLDLTTTEDILNLYKVDTEDYYEELQSEDTELKGSSNPNNYAWLSSDIHLVVIKRTARNEKIAGKVITQILSALKEMGK